MDDRGERTRRKSIAAALQRGPLHGAGRLQPRILTGAGGHQERRLGRVVRRPIGDQLMQHDAERIDVGPGIDLIDSAGELLRAHVQQRAYDLAGHGAPG